MHIENRPLWIVVACGFGAEFTINFLAVLVQRNIRSTGLFGPEKEDVLFMFLVAAMFVGVGLIVSTSIGAFYSWLCRNEVLAKRDHVNGGAVSAALAAFAGKALIVTLSVLSTAITEKSGQAVAEAACGNVFGLLFSVLIGALFGAIGARLMYGYIESQQEVHTQ